MRAAAIQLNSNADKSANLELAGRLVAAAAAAGAELVVLPEKWNLLGDAEQIAAGAEDLDRGPSIAAARGWARELGINLVAGSVAERVEGEQRSFNTSFVFDREGELVALYRKIHMFDVDVGGVSYRESDARAAGRGDRRRRSRRGRRRADHLLRPALPRAVPDPRDRGARES